MPDKKLRAIELLAQRNITVKAIAEELQVSRTTIYAWLKDAEFKAKLEEMNRLRDAYLKQELKDKAEDYIRALEKLGNNSKNDMVKLRALENLLMHSGWNQTQEVTVKTDESESKNAMIQLLKQKENKE
ncbi:phBC6A51 family helix-turn-helix protein [Salipaludibacillus sp. HK11]|uniref:phBC6A51 family helix-turn-helix protein n=1 Tax=Salipaludibacillus sp. HK11 TaxID=3394320 RepID=UPI0039FDDE81